MLLRAGLTLAAAVPLVASAVAACSSTDAAPGVAPESGTCEAYVPPTTFDPTTPTVSFTNDVVPLINRSCAFTSCHGSVAGPTGGMYLGTETSKMYLNLVGVASTIEPSMLRVKAGDPANSFLQHKIDGDACTLSDCTSSDCQELMPQGQDLMAVTDRLTFRAWIAQGAQADFTIVYPAEAGAGDDDAGGGGANEAGASEGGRTTRAPTPATRAATRAETDMIGRLTGVAVEDADGGLVLDVNGVGYELQAPMGTLGRATRDPDGRVTLRVHTHVREDALTLYGFVSEMERLTFRTLIAISSIGPKTALGILSALPAADLARAVAAKDLKRLTDVPGVGKKTAERLVLELRDKLPTLGTADAPAPPRAASAGTPRETLVSALVNMGYRAVEAERAVGQLEGKLDGASLADLVREALVLLAK